MLPLFSMIGGGVDEFPFVQAKTQSEDTSAGTSHVVSLPAGVGDGDLLLVGFSTPANETITWPGGWTVMFSQAASPDLEVAFRVASGEGATITVTTSGSVTSLHLSYSIRGHLGILDDASSQTGSDINPDPTSLTPFWGNRKGLFIPFAAAAGGSASSMSSAPSNYTDLSQIGESAHVIAAAQRQIKTTTENPGTFTLSGTSPWIANTIGIRGI